MDITKLIADQLNSLFPDIDIYRENIEGGFKEPSFFIQRVNLVIFPRLFEMQKRVYNYHIVYFPKLTETGTPSKEDIDTMAEMLAIDLQEIEGLAHLDEREMILGDDDTLHYSFSLEVHVKPEESYKFNQNLDINTKIKEGQNETN